MSNEAALLLVKSSLLAPSIASPLFFLPKNENTVDLVFLSLRLLTEAYLAPSSAESGGNRGREGYWTRE